MRVLILGLIVFMGCATLSPAELKEKAESKQAFNTSTIKITGTGVDFLTNKPASMVYEKDGVKVSYDSKAESLISKILSILTLGIVGAK